MYVYKYSVCVSRAGPAEKGYNKNVTGENNSGGTAGYERRKFFTRSIAMVVCAGPGRTSAPKSYTVYAVVGTHTTVSTPSRAYTRRALAVP